MIVSWRQIYRIFCKWKTCDNCSSLKSLVDKNVTDIARQLVELVKATGQKYSTAHILEVYRGSISQTVKKHKHHTLKLHGAGKDLAKGEAPKILRYLVVEKILSEVVRKNDTYGSVSSVLKVNYAQGYRLSSGSKPIMMRFPVPVKASNASQCEAAEAKGSLLSDITGPTPSGVHAQAPKEVDANLSEKLYVALRALRSSLIKEAGEGVYAYHIYSTTIMHRISESVPKSKKDLWKINGLGKVKIAKYGNRILETVRATVKEYKKASTNISSKTMKRRRVSADSDANENGFTQRTVQSKKRTTKGIADLASSMSTCNDPIDVDLDGDEIELEEINSSTKRRRGYADSDASDGDFIERTAHPNGVPRMVSISNCNDRIYDVDLDGDSQFAECSSKKQGGSGRVLPQWPNRR